MNTQGQIYQDLYQKLWESVLKNPSHRLLSMIFKVANTDYLTNARGETKQAFQWALLYLRNKMDRDYAQASPSQKPYTSKGKLLAEISEELDLFKKKRAESEEKAIQAQELMTLFDAVLRRNIIKAIPQTFQKLQRTDIHEPSYDLHTTNANGNYDSDLWVDFAKALGISLARDFWRFLQTLPFEQRYNQGGVTRKLNLSEYGRSNQRGASKRPFFQIVSISTHKQDRYTRVNYPTIEYFGTEKFAKNPKYPYMRSFELQADAYGKKYGVSDPWDVMVRSLLFAQVMPFDVIFHPDGKIEMVGQDELRGKDISPLLNPYQAFKLKDEIVTRIKDAISELYHEKNAPKVEPKPKLETKTQQSASATPSLPSSLGSDDPFAYFEEKYTTKKGKVLDVWRISIHPDMPKSAYRLDGKDFAKLDKGTWFDKYGNDGWRSKKLEDIQFIREKLLEKHGLDKVEPTTQAKKIQAASQAASIPQEIQNFLHNVRINPADPNSEAEYICIKDPFKDTVFCGTPRISGNMIVFTGTDESNLSLSFDALIQQLSADLGKKHLLLDKTTSTNPNKTMLHTVLHPNRVKEEPIAWDYAYLLPEMEKLYIDLRKDTTETPIKPRVAQTIAKLAVQVLTRLHIAYANSTRELPQKIRIPFVAGSLDGDVIEIANSEYDAGVVSIPFKLDATYKEILDSIEALYLTMFSQLERVQKNEQEYWETEQERQRRLHPERDPHGSFRPSTSKQAENVLVDKLGKAYQEIGVNVEVGADKPLLKISPAPKGRPAYEDADSTQQIELLSRTGIWRSDNPNFYTVHVLYPKEAQLEYLYNKAQHGNAAQELMDFMNLLTKEQVHWLLRDYGQKASNDHRANLKKLSESVIKKASKYHLPPKR